MGMRSAWTNGALLAAAVAVGGFTLAAFHAPTQTAQPGGSATPLPTVSSTLSAAGNKHPVPNIKHTHKPKPPKKTAHKHKHKSKSTYTPPAYTPPPQPTYAPQPTPAPILPTLPGGGGTQIPVPP
jgi:hypothetical protein